MAKLLPISRRAADIEPFHVMDILARAKALEALGRDILHLEIGEPDFATPQPIIDAGIKALQNHHTFYTSALGLPALREAIADWYQSRYGLTISPRRIIVTPGASGALLLVLGALLEQGKNVLMTDPGYPCNRHFARFLEGRAKPVPVGADSAFQLTAQHITDYWDTDSQLALVASPSNPTGTVLLTPELKALANAVKAQNGTLIVDEIYHGLTYDDIQLPSVLEVDDEAIVINSFSKFFGMTGWRLGWAVVPESLEPVMDRLAQNLYLAAPTISQYAALAAFQPDTLAILESRRQQFESRRDFLLPALADLGFQIPVKPQGAFYIYADCSRFLNEQIPDGMALSQYLLDKAGVAITPGNDFGEHLSSQYCRFAYTKDIKLLTQLSDKIKQLYGN